MGASSFEIAVRDVVIAAATASHLVRVVSFDPLSFKPDNLLDLTLAAIGLKTPEAIATFKALLMEGQRSSVQNGLRTLELNGDVIIQLIADHLEALLEGAGG